MLITPDSSKKTIRDKSRAFSVRWINAKSEQSEKQTFWNEFLAIFGIDRKQVAAFEALAARTSTGNKGWVDLIYPNQMAVEHKSKGENLDLAMAQLYDYLPTLIHKSITPWLLVVCDFKRFKWQNLPDQSSGEFDLEDLVDNIHLFWWMAGHESPIEAFESEEDCNLKATQIMAELHDALEAASYPEADRRVWLTRILFCMFADSTDVWDRAAFHAFVAHQTREDGSDLGSRIAELFQVLDTSIDGRSNLLTEELSAFTYINGDLFTDQIKIPSCNERIRSDLLRACKFNWSAISPAIFGSMFQDVMKPEEQREIGGHYTEEENILRLIRPLFLDDLELELERCISLSKLRDFHDKLATLNFIDPACGCGNFLVVTYREVRRLETITIEKLISREVLETKDKKRRRISPGQLGVDLKLLCKVSISQFYGIEKEEFPAQIARTAMYLIDHIANRQVSSKFGQNYIRFPIPASSTIIVGNALSIDWNTVLSSEDACYVIGNPPFVGITFRTDQQTIDLKAVWGKRYHGTLDYVTGWYKKTVEYIGDEPIRAAFLSTNSICQGEQVAPLWRYILDVEFKIDFAHRTFKWASKARSKANVHCIIVGFSKKNIDTQRRLFDYPDLNGEPTEISAKNINPYLIDYKNIIVSPVVGDPISSQLPEVRYGNKPTDGSGLIIGLEEYSKFMADPIAAKYVRKYVGVKELLYGKQRWCLWLLNAPPGEIKKSHLLTERVERVRKFRLDSDAPSTREYASKASIFKQRTQQDGRFICIPRHVSEARKFFVCAYFDSNVIASDATFIADDPEGIIFSVLASSMFITWLRTVGGKIKSDPRFNKLLVYNTFPMPYLSEKSKKSVLEAGQRVLDIRASYPESTLAELYEAEMRVDLINAHKSLDRVVDRAFGLTSRSITEYARLRRLFELYETVTTPLINLNPEQLNQA